MNLARSGSPTPEKAMDSLSICGIVHYTCHGMTDNADLSNGYLALYSDKVQQLKGRLYASDIFASAIVKLMSCTRQQALQRKIRLMICSTRRFTWPVCPSLQDFDATSTYRDKQGRNMSTSFHPVTLIFVIDLLRSPCVWSTVERHLRKRVAIFVKLARSTWY